MAYGLKYKLQFDDIHITDPVTWKVEFYFKDYTGEPTDLIGSETPLVITRGEDGQDKMTPIVGSQATIGIVITDDTFDKTQFFAEQFSIRVDVLRADVLWWSGFVKPDYCEFPYLPAPYTFTVIATDGLALLKNTLVDLIDIREGDGYVSILNLLMEKGMFLCGHGLDNLRVISSLRRTDAAQTFKNLRTRYELWQDDTGAFMNVYDILTQIATSFTGRIFFDQGYAWFQRIGDLWKAGPAILQYSDSAVDPEEVTLTSSFFKILKGDISSAEMIYLNNDSHITMMAAYKQAQIDLDYKFRTWLLNGDWHDFDASTGFSHWSNNGNAVVDQHGAGTADDPFLLYYQKNDSATGIIFQAFGEVPNASKFDLKTRVTFYKTDRTAFRLYVTKTAAAGEEPDDDTLKLFAYRNGTWVVLAPDGFQGPKPGADDNNFIQRPKNSTVTGVNYTDVNIQMDYFNAIAESDYDHGDTFSFLIYILDPDGTVSETSDFNGMEVSEIKLSVIENAYTGETYTNRTGKNYSKYAQIGNFSLIDAISNNVANKLDYNGDDDGQIWTANDIPSNIGNFQGMALYSIMNVYSEPFRIMSGTYYSNKVKFFNTIQQAFGDYRLFMQLYDQYNVRMCEHEMTLAELKQTTGIAEGSTSKRKFKTN